MESREFLKKVAFSQMHIFKYSKREGTKAAAIENQIPENIKSLRSEELISLNGKMHEEYLMKFAGKEKEVLFEEEIEINGEKYFVGHTEEYIKAVVKADEFEVSPENQIIKVKVEKMLNNEIMLATI